MPEVAITVLNEFKYQMRWSPDLVVYKSEKSGKIIFYDERSKKMFELEPGSLRFHRSAKEDVGC